MRWYDAEIGRWLSKDPIGLTGGLNLYAFCDDTPIVYADPRGERWASVIVGGAILGVGYIIIRHAINTKRTFDNANVDDLRDIASKMVDCAEDTMTAVTPIFGPPNPDASIPLTDKATDVIARPLWKRVFDKIRPTR